MKGPNPLLPQGSFEAQAQRKSHFRIAVFTIIAVHLVVIGALLIQGCKRDTTDVEAGLTNDAFTVPPFTNQAPEVVTPAAPSSSTPSEVPEFPPADTAVAPPPLPPRMDSIPSVQPPPLVQPAEAPAGTEHTILKGDTFSVLAGKYGVTVRAIQNANPGVDPARLKIGQKIQIPSRADTTTRTAPGAPATAAASDTYTVKSGDTLSKIARNHGTTIREIQRLNNLATTQIRVGQKLKLPQRASPPPASGAGGTFPAPVP